MTRTLPADGTNGLPVTVAPSRILSHDVQPGQTIRLIDTGDTYRVESIEGHWIHLRAKDIATGAEVYPVLHIMELARAGIELIG